jgi:excisionase family DNA binding protein
VVPWRVSHGLGGQRAPSWRCAARGRHGLPAGQWPDADTSADTSMNKGREGKAYMPHQTHSVVEAATVLGCSPRTIRRHLRAGCLPGVKFGRDWVVWGPLDTADVAGPAPRPRGQRSGLPARGRGAPHHHGEPCRPGPVGSRDALPHLADAPWPAGDVRHRSSEPHPGLGPLCPRGGVTLLAGGADAVAARPAAAATV